MLMLKLEQTRLPLDSGNLFVFKGVFSLIFRIILILLTFPVFRDSQKRGLLQRWSIKVVGPIDYRTLVLVECYLFRCQRFDVVLDAKALIFRLIKEAGLFGWTANALWPSATTKKVTQR